MQIFDEILRQYIYTGRTVNKARIVDYLTINGEIPVFPRDLELLITLMEVAVPPSSGGIKLEITIAD